MRKLLYFFFLFICLSRVSAQQTYTVTGIVTDDKDIPIPGATVFIADSKKVTASDRDGRFTLTQVQPGNYNLVVKMMGFVVLQHGFMLQNADARFRFKLKEDNIMLNTANITAMSLPERKRLLAIFTACFLGRSKNAAQCKILNTDDINIQFDRKRFVLTASSSEFLIIENKALGYTMKYLLDNFTYDRSGFRSVITFGGTLFFEEMKGSAAQQKRWVAERVNTYLGSVPHFFRSVFNGTLDENGFVVYQMLNRAAIDVYGKRQQRIPSQYLQPVTSFDKFINKVDENFKTFNLDLLTKDSTELYTVYTLKKEPKDFLEGGMAVQRFFQMPGGQLSVMQPIADSILINRSGDISPVSGILLSGFLAWGQVAAFLPSDYEVPAGMEPPKVKKYSAP